MPPNDPRLAGRRRHNTIQYLPERGAPRLQLRLDQPFYLRPFRFASRRRPLLFREIRSRADLAIPIAQIRRLRFCIPDFGFRLSEFRRFTLAGLAWLNHSVVKSRLSARICHNVNRDLFLCDVHVGIEIGFVRLIFGNGIRCLGRAAGRLYFAIRQFGRDGSAHIFIDGFVCLIFRDCGGGHDRAATRVSRLAVFARLNHAVVKSRIDVRNRRNLNNITVFV